MPANYYDDGAPAEQASMPAESGSPEQAEDRRDSEKTALIPRSITGGKDFQPGDEIVLEVVRVLEDELMVQYASEKGNEKSGEDEPSMSGASSDNESAMHGGGGSNYYD